MGLPAEEEGVGWAGLSRSFRREAVFLERSEAAGIPWLVAASGVSVPIDTSPSLSVVTSRSGSIF